MKKPSDYVRAMDAIPLTLMLALFFASGWVAIRGEWDRAVIYLGVGEVVSISLILRLFFRWFSAERKP